MSKFQDVDPGTSQQIKDVGTIAANSANDLSHQTLRGANEGQSFLAHADNFDRGLGGSMSAMRSAIDGRMNQKANLERDRLKTQVDYEAINRRFQRLATATDLANQEMAHNQRAAQLRYQQRLAKRQMRGQILGAVLGTVGAIGGAIYGGPAGAMAGAQVGNSLGNMAGSNL